MIGLNEDLNMKKVIKEYNDIMIDVCYEHSMIEPQNSDTEGWNLRDMVAECDYILSCYYENGHCREEMRHGDSDDRKVWKQETTELKKFIDKYKNQIGNIKVTEKHCSKYDK